MSQVTKFISTTKIYLVKDFLDKSLQLSYDILFRVCQDWSAQVGLEPGWQG